MLKYRILSALVMVPAVIAGLFLLSTTAFAIAVLAICMLAAWEWAQFLGLKKQSHRIGIALVFGLVLLSMLQATQGYVQLIDAPVVQITLLMSLGWWIAATGLVLTYPNSAPIWQRSMLIRLFFGFLTIAPFFFGLITLRQYGDLHVGNYMGAWGLLYVMVLVWGADSGAYAFGRMFGKHKLAPKVSPGKTWEGAIGGLVTSAVIALLVIVLMSSRLAALNIDITTLLMCSVVAVVASVLGDLTESMFKRQAGIKDSSQLIPGHGGILDRIDSLTAAIPVFTGLLLLVFATR